MTDQNNQVENIVEEVHGDEVATWRVINNGAFGRLIHPDAKEGEYMVMIRLETVDVDGRNPMVIEFGCNPGALESMVGSAGATLLNTEKDSDAVILYNLWNSALKAINSSDEEHHPDCPHRD